MSDDQRLAEALERADTGIPISRCPISRGGELAVQLGDYAAMRESAQVLAARVRELEAELATLEAERDRLWDEIEGKEREAG